ncbi:MAG TPA: PKD domain-containing protein [Planctomycetota bacterium]|nr:PKD domain-containing protein [Planctomycetota bacterium]
MSLTHRAVVIFVALFGAVAFAADQEAQPSLGKIPPNLAEIGELVADPNPADVGETVDFSFELKNAAKIPDDAAAVASITLNFGDGTQQTLTVDDVDAIIQHTYTVAGVYQARLTVSAGGFFDQISTFVIVGDGTVVNVLNGLTMTATDANGQPRPREVGDGPAGSRFVGGVVNIAVNITRTFGSSATTDFEDIPGRQSLAVPGLNVQHTFSQKGIFVATSRSLSFSGTEVAKMRQMLVISGTDVAESGALPNAPNTTITMKKLSGKFLFTKNTPDQVQFSGIIQLPAGFDPSRPDGNSLTVGIGNNVDTFTVDSKGKAKLPGATGRITKAKVKFPKLAGPAVGGEEAQVASRSASRTWT